MKRKNLKKMSRRIFSVLLLCLSISVMGQNYQWQAKLDTITADGFYRVQLLPGIVSKCESRCNDIRIYDAQSKEVPFIIQKPMPKPDSLLFREYKILSTEHTKKLTTLVLQNTDKNKIDNIQLVIKNADVSKTLRLSGSDDMKQWYVIKDDYSIWDVYSNTATSTIKIFDFPLSDYQYFKIEIFDTWSPPINVLKAGYYDTYKEDTKYSELPRPDISQIDSSSVKESYVKIDFGSYGAKEKMYFEVEGPKYYHRECTFGTMHIDTAKNGKITKSFNPLGIQITLSTNGSNTLYDFHILYDEKCIWMKISNDDNPPIKIKAVKVYWMPYSLIAYLQKGKSYKLNFGAKGVSAPVYDLINFKDSISSVSPVALGAIVSIAQTKAQAASAGPSNKTLIWAALAIVLLLLGVMSTRMIKEMGKKE